MTEEEAKTKRCCGPSGCGTLSAGIYEQYLTMSGNVSVQLSFCIGSACMAWRWDDKEGLNGILGGHCGLAGKP